MPHKNGHLQFYNHKALKTYLNKSKEISKLVGISVAIIRGDILGEVESSVPIRYQSESPAWLKFLMDQTKPVIIAYLSCKYE